MTKKYILLVVMLVIATVILCGCNTQIIDTTWKFDRAVISLANGRVIDGEVQSWLDFENSDMIQVKINGVSYLTHSSNVVLIAE